MMNNDVWLCKAKGRCTEYFIIGDPRVPGKAYVFAQDTQTGDVTHRKLAGVFEDYERVSIIPKWVRKPLLSLILNNTDEEYKSLLHDMNICGPGLAMSSDTPDPGMKRTYHTSDEEKYNIAWHAAHCKVESCKRCQAMCDNGLVVSCDRCGCVHHTDWLGWIGIMYEDEVQVTVLCPDCDNELKTKTNEHS